jgi:serine/threonine protein kinase
MGPNDDETSGGATLPLPDPDEARAPTVAGERPDTLSTEAQTLAAEPVAARRESIVDIPSVATPLNTGTDRYTLGELIGRGGMGEVMLANDQQIGRDVAIKRMRFKPSAQGYARFLREARIQGRLDHPAIVPVHELSIDGDGRPFFAMKRLTGTTLHDIFDQLREGDPFAVEHYSRQRLLRAFNDVCLAVEFAHTRGVIHRDLKPANIVLGDFGEVYVLDWGIARVVADGGEGTAGASGDLESLGAGEPGAPGETEVGVILGTPGYIPPEQIRGDATLDHRADVYALGCILFEILAAEPLLPRGRHGLTAAFGEVDARPSQRPGGREVPPELDALCIDATQSEPAARTATARALGDQLQRYLDGDRDLELRRKVASEHIAAARAALARGDGEAERRDAMREAGRALALDPTATDAADLAGHLLLAPPTTIPREVEEEIRDLDDSELRTMTRVAIGAFAVYLLFVPVLVWIGVRDPRYLIALVVGIVLNGMVAMAVSRTKNRIGPPWIWAAVVGNVVLIGIVAHIVNPFLVAPGIAGGTMMAFSLYPFIRHWVLWLLLSASVLVPWLLEVAGYLPSTMSTENGDLVMHAPAIEFNSPQIAIALALYVLCLVGVTGLMARRLSDAQRDARRKLQVQAWHLRQLMPTRP